MKRYAKYIVLAGAGLAILVYRSTVAFPEGTDWSRIFDEYREHHAKVTSEATEVAIRTRTFPGGPEEKTVEVTAPEEVRAILDTFALEDLTDGGKHHECIGHLVLSVRERDRVLAVFEFDHGNMFYSKEYRKNLGFRTVSDAKAKRVQDLLVKYGFTLAEIGVSEEEGR